MQQTCFCRFAGFPSSPWASVWRWCDTCIPCCSVLWEIAVYPTMEDVRQLALPLTAVCCCPLSCCPRSESSWQSCVPSCLTWRPSTRMPPTSCTMLTRHPQRQSWQHAMMQSPGVPRLPLKHNAFPAFGRPKAKNACLVLNAKQVADCKHLKKVKTQPSDMLQLHICMAVSAALSDGHCSAPGCAGSQSTMDTVSHLTSKTKQVTAGSWPRTGQKPKSFGNAADAAKGLHCQTPAFLYIVRRFSKQVSQLQEQLAAVNRRLQVLLTLPRTCFLRHCA